MAITEISMALWFIFFGVSGFIDEVGHQLSLFEEYIEDNDTLDSLEDIVKNKFGKHSIVRAESLGNKSKK